MAPGCSSRCRTPSWSPDCAELGFSLPGPRYYGVGMIFLPQDEALRRDFEQRLEQIAEEEGQRVLGWRTVPTDGSSLGPTSGSAQPLVRQVFLERSPLIKDRMSFERKLFVIRKRAEQSHSLCRAAWRPSNSTSAQMSFKTMVYKGMLTPTQVRPFYPELSDPEFDIGLGDGAFAFQHQHLPLLGSRAPLPLPGP